MKKVGLICLTLLVVVMLNSCKSIDSLMKEGKYEEAYELAKTENERNAIIDKLINEENYSTVYSLAKTNEEKVKIIDLLINKGQKEKAMKLLSDDYYISKDNKQELLNKFIDLLDVKYTGDTTYKKIAEDAYEKIDFNEYNKKWMAFNCYYHLSLEAETETFLRTLINKKGFVGLTTNNDTEAYKRYKWVTQIKPKIKNLISTEFQARTRAETEQKQKNAINSITDVLVKYGQSRYQDDWDCGKQGEYYNDDDIGVVAVKIGNTIYVFDYLGIVDKWTYNLPKGYNFWHQMNMYNADRNTYDMMRGMNKTYGNMLGLEALSKDTYAYFENITNDVFIKELLGSLKK